MWLMDAGHSNTQLSVSFPIMAFPGGILKTFKKSVKHDYLVLAGL